MMFVQLYYYTNIDEVSRKDSIYGQWDMCKSVWESLDLSGVGGGVQGGASAPPKFWFVKIIPGKISENFGKIPENTGKNSAQRCLI